MNTLRKNDRLSGRVPKGAAGFFLGAGSSPALLKGLLALLLWCGVTSLWAGDPDHCVACGKLLTGESFYSTDEVTREKVFICSNCEAASPVCFFCGVPVNTNSCLRLPDGRVLCAREAKTAVLNEAEAIRLCNETRDALDRLFSRFLAFPATNVEVAVMDRVHLQELFKFAGNDFSCPNVWGYIQSPTNHQHLEHHMSLLSGLPLDSFQATCAHEYGHAWLNENLPPGRKQSLGRDANEGFCELLAYLLMSAQSNEAAQAQILRNAYTRGQIRLFIDAEKNFGFNEVLEWMKYGADSSLVAEEPNRIKNLRPPARPAPVSAPALVPAPAAAAAAQPPFGAVTLKAIFWDQRHPSAIINGRTFQPNEEKMIPWGSTNATLRCLEIRSNSVLVQLLGQPAPQELSLTHHH